MPQHRFKPGDPKLGGRKCGTPNRMTTILKDAILQAATEEGGGNIVTYLRQQVREQPGPFLALLGRVLPLQLQNDRDNPRLITQINYVITDPKEPNQAHRPLDGQGEGGDAQELRDRPLARLR